MLERRRHLQQRTVSGEACRDPCLMKDSLEKLDGEAESADEVLDASLALPLSGDLRLPCGLRCWMGCGFSRVGVDGDLWATLV